ncbi:hypothetical protein N7G274_000288 [Stereocaulon virgatum]|uniref:Extracellular membrane protein CFEM domain-containing protein n=1 Tax=Stereocaulon virgatum TaxID=373712 RepID=A0ABR4AU35_9LECA
MHNPTMLPLTLLAIILPTIHAITLSSFQAIDGFSTACVNAYNTPLSGCTASDFSSGQCSTTCITFLDSLTNVLNAVCQGSSAYPNTLVGAFFQGEGTATLCPNVVGQESGGAKGSAPTGTEGLPSSTSSYTQSTVKAMTSTIIATRSVSASTSSTASVVATTTSVVIVSATVVPNAPPHLLTTASSKSTSPTSTPSSSSSSSSSALTSSGSGGGGNGGGTILDVGSSSACHNARIEAGVLSLLAGLAGLVWLL